jgi:hypothetical protein
MVDGKAAKLSTNQVYRKCIDNRNSEAKTNESQRRLRSTMKSRWEIQVDSSHLRTLRWTPAYQLECLVLVKKTRKRISIFCGEPKLVAKLVEKTRCGKLGV